MPETIAQATKRPYKPRKTNKSPALQAKVLMARGAGTPKEQIARNLGIAKNTVTNIIELNDFDRELETSRTLSVGLIAPAIETMHKRLKQGSENAAIKVLENTIWPLDRKGGKNGDAGLTLAIQNLLMGPTQVNVAPATTTNSDSTSQTNAPADNSNVKPHQE